MNHLNENNLVFIAENTPKNLRQDIKSNMLFFQYIKMSISLNLILYRIYISKLHNQEP